jgi:phage recombination protein Bet
MTNELAKVEQGTTALTAPIVTPAQLELVKRTIAPDATPDELQLFCYDCARQGVHPLDRLIHFTKRGKNGKYTPITSIDFMRQRAADSGEYAGNDDAMFTGKPGTDGFIASVTVWRIVQGQRCGFTATARWNEYKPAPGPSGNADMMWKKMEHIMLAKCAEALALRKAFPKQTAKLYEWAEMAQAGAFEQKQTTPPAQPIRQPQRKAPPSTEALRGEQAQAQVANNDGVDENGFPLEPGSNDGADETPLDDLQITKIGQAKGKTDKGPWCCTFVTCSDGKTYSTFDEAVAAFAQKAFDEKRGVLITAAEGKTNKKGEVYYPILQIS